MPGACPVVRPVNLGQGVWVASNKQTEHVLEVETKLEARDGFVLPDLTGDVQQARLPGVCAVGERREEDVDATYFDTVDLRLTRAGITLRRRTGGADAGWHLKRPTASRSGEGDNGAEGGNGADGGASAREEVRLPLGRSTVSAPAALASKVQVHLQGAKPVPVVRLHTHRTVTPLLGADGAVLAEVAYDQVAATRLAPSGPAGSARSAGQPGRSEESGGSRVVLWSEVEVELVSAGGSKGEELLRTLSDRLSDAGAARASYSSKLARCLAEFGLSAAASPSPSSQGPVRWQGRRPRRRSAAAVVLAHLAEQVAKLQAQDAGVRADDPDAVHQMRVATRRLRSALATFRPLFDPSITDPLREELKWLGEVLGGARDAEVIRDHLTQVLAAEPGDLVLGPVQEWIVATMSARHRRAHDEVLAELDGARYAALLDALNWLIDRPPLTPPADLRPDKVLLPLVAKTWRKMRRLHHQIEQAAAEPGTTAQEHDHLLHELRKAAKRARYAGESLTPAYGRKAKDWARRIEAIQEILGAHQDTVVIREQLRAMAVSAFLDGKNAFTFGRLHALEQARADLTERDYSAAWKAAATKPGHRWLVA